MKLAEIQVSYHPKSSDKPQIKTSQDAYEVIKPLYNEDIMQYKEIFMVLYLNNVNRVLGYHEHPALGVVSKLQPYVYQTPFDNLL